MLYDPDIDEALRHIEEAQSRLGGGKRTDNGDQAAPLEKAHQWLDAAERELRSHRAAEQPDLGEALGSGNQVPPDPEQASQALGLLSLLRFQLEKTAQQVEPLGPGGDPTAPLQRIEQADLEEILSSLARLRRRAGAMEAELRPLKRQRGENDPRVN